MKTSTMETSKMKTSKLSMIVVAAVVASGLWAAGALAATPMSTNFDGLATTIDWMPTGGAGDEDWDKQWYVPEGDPGDLWISDTIYHGSSGKSMGLDRDGGENAPRPAWLAGMDSTVNTLSFWGYRIDGGARWYINYNTDAVFDDSAVGIYWNGTDIQVDGANGSELLGADLGTETWYKIVFAMDFDNDQATVSVFDESDVQQGSSVTRDLWAPSSPQEYTQSVYAYPSAVEGDPLLYWDDFQTAVPEPGAIVMLLAGVCLFALKRRNRR